MVHVFDPEDALPGRETEDVDAVVLTSSGSLSNLFHVSDREDDSGSSTRSAWEPAPPDPVVRSGHHIIFGQVERRLVHGCVTDAIFVSSSSESLRGIEEEDSELEDRETEGNLENRAHSSGTCRPCPFFATTVGCLGGAQCGFCHLDHGVSMGRRPIEDGLRSRRKARNRRQHALATRQEDGSRTETLDANGVQLECSVGAVDP
mmetsp:Transcript_21005/g.56008  ORF Transcript_21005/g.56008 Transcript_21005/m.56008 type:complete len:204 (-) Transcript_21005:117-728(-)